MNLDPTFGSEIKKSRPCVVVSPADLNEYLRMVILAPMTSKGFAAPFRVAVTYGGTKGLILLDQVRRYLGQQARRCGGEDASADLSTLQEDFTK